MTEPAWVASTGRSERRSADRRRGAAALLTSLAQGISLARETAGLRERFEDDLRTLLAARAVVLRDEPSIAPRPDVMCVDVPGPAPHHRARLEVTFEPVRLLDGWTCQVLETAKDVAALLLEIERARGRPAPSTRHRPDGAAPLIGSSAAIRSVRQRIERIAATDFTVLIEGSIAR